MLPRCAFPKSLAQHTLCHDTMHIGEPKIPPGVTIGEPLVIKPQQMQHRRVQVVNVNPIAHCLGTVIVGGPVGMPTARSSAGHPRGEGLLAARLLRFAASLLRAAALVAADTGPVAATLAAELRRKAAFDCQHALRFA